MDNRDLLRMAGVLLGVGIVSTLLSTLLIGFLFLIELGGNPWVIVLL